MRHAKSDWDSEYSGDHERPLSRRGVKAATKIGKWISENEFKPDLIVCSTALRTRQTLDLVQENAGWKELSIDFDEQIYLASPDSVLRLIRSLGDEIESAMIIGHQPFTGVVASALLSGRHLEVPTGCLIGMDLNTESWSGAGRSAAKLSFYTIPRSLP